MRLVKQSCGWLPYLAPSDITTTLRFSISRSTTSKIESNVTQPPNHVKPTTTMTDASRSHHSRRKRSRRRKLFTSDDVPLEIRVGNRRVSGYYAQIQATSGADAGRFDRMVDDTIRSNPRDPITMYVHVAYFVLITLIKDNVTTRIDSSLAEQLMGISPG